MGPWFLPRRRSHYFSPLFRLRAAFEDQSLGGREALVEQGQGVAQMLRITKVRANASAQFGLVNEFVRRRQVLEWKFRAQKRPVDIRRFGLAQTPGRAFRGASANLRPPEQGRSLLLGSGWHLVVGVIKSLRNGRTILRAGPMPVQVPNLSEADRGPTEPHACALPTRPDGRIAVAVIGQIAGEFFRCNSLRRHDR